MENELKHLMVSIISDDNIGSMEDLSLFLTKNEKYIDKIVKASESNDWVYFDKQTYDGWYCIDKGTVQDEFEVYNQERGGVGWGDFKVSGRAQAVAMVISYSGYLDF